jgi:hypothetical protein
MESTVPSRGDRHPQGGLGGYAERRSHGLSHPPGVIGKQAEPDQHVQLDVGEARTGGLADPLHLLRGHLGGQVRGRFSPSETVLEVGVHAHDVGFASSDGEHPPPSATDDDRRVRALAGLRGALVGVYLVVPAAEGERTVGHKALDHFHPFLEAVDPLPGWVVDNARLVVVRTHPARAQPQLQPPVGKQVERCRFLGQGQGVAIVVVENQGADPEGRCGVGCGHHGRDGCQLVTKVVGKSQRRVAEGFRLAGLVGPVVA